MEGNLVYRQVRGVVPILLTPFDQFGRIDTESLSRVVEFNIQAGVHGVGIAIGSEIFRLSEDERDLTLTTVVEQVGGRIPVIMNSGAPGTDLAIHYCKRAQEHGADMVMVLPPSTIQSMPDSEGVRRYYRDIARSIEIPVMIQDAGPTPVPPALVAEIAEESESVTACKTETPPTPARIASTVKAVRGNINVLGGGGGNFLIEELQRGSVGTMPFCSMPAEFVEIWNQFHAGNIAEAKRVFYERILPVNRLAGANLNSAYAVHKEILKRRGLIESAHVREPATPLDGPTLKELDAVYEQSVAMPPGA